MAVVRGHLAGFPVVLSSATPSIEVAGQRRCRPLPAHRPRRPLRRRRSCPRSRRSTCARDQPERGRFLSPPLVAAIAETLAREAAGAPLPQPPRLCAADPLPHLRPPLPVPQLLDLAGRAPLPRRAPLPPLRPHRAAARRPARAAATTDSLVAGRAGRRAARRGGRGAFPGRAHHRHVERHRRRRASACASSSPRSPRARSTSSSAPSSSPRATTSRC